MERLYKTLLTLGFLLPLIIFGQGIQITIEDQKTGDPIENVMGVVSFKGTNKREIFISNDAGKLNIPHEPPFELRLSHLNFEDQQLTVNNNQPISVSLKNKEVLLDDIVITGQYRPQSASNSVYNVKTIDESTIQSIGAVQVTDVLSKQLNIGISSDVAIGSSTMSMQGIASNNIKILVDGVPLVNRNGNGNGADLSQINVINIERIEIVEGPMAVNYGANALAGVINIITKKAEDEGYRIGITAQSETIDSQYSLDNGISNINLTSSISLTEKFKFSFNGGFSRFGGFYGNNTGRAHLWNPKDQAFSDASLIYKSGHFDVTYKFENFFEKIDDLGELQEEVHQATGAIRNFGIDEEYKSKRYSHQVQANGKLSDYNRFNLVLSNSDFTREKRKFRNYVGTGEEIEQTADGSSDTTSYNTFLVRGNFQNINPNKQINYQLGFEINAESTSGGRIKDREEQSMVDYAGFLSFEWKPTEEFKVRPGVRMTANSVFDGSIMPSVNLKYKLNQSWAINAAYGRGYRTPSLRELFFEFVDANHNIIGNENISPETSNHYDFGLSYNWIKNGKGLKSSVSFFYNDISNRISMSQSLEDIGVFTFFNLSGLKTIGFNINESFTWKSLMVDVGFGLTGRKEDFGADEKLREYLYTPELTTNLNYSHPKSKIKINVLYKYNGKQSNYFANSEGILEIGDREAFHLTDVSLNRTVLKNTTLFLGVKNLFDVTVINTTTVGGGAHGGGSAGINVGTGRSYFFKLAFNLKSNK